MKKIVRIQNYLFSGLREVERRLFNTLANFILYRFPIVPVITFVIFITLALYGYLKDVKEASVSESYIIEGSNITQLRKEYFSQFPLNSKQFAYISVITAFEQEEKEKVHQNIQRLEYLVQGIDLSNKWPNCTFNRTVYARLTLSDSLRYKEVIGKSEIFRGKYEDLPVKAMINNNNGWNTWWCVNYVSSDQNSCLLDIGKEVKKIYISIFNETNLNYRSEIVTLYDFLDEMQKTTKGDMPILVFGYVCVAIFLIFSLGEMNIRRNRILVSIVGISLVGLSYLVGISIPSFFNYKYGPMNRISIVMIAGVGVDDLFVICAEYDFVAEKLGDRRRIFIRMLERAGLAIFLTTLTDCMGLVTGSTAFVFALQSLCIFTITSLLMLFLVTVICFTSTLHASALLQDKLCNNSPDEQPYKSKSYTASIFHLMANFLFQHLLVRILVMVIAVMILGIGVFGVVNVKSDFSNADYLKYLFTDDSFAKHYLELSYELYERNPKEEVKIFFRDVDICQQNMRESLRVLHDKVISTNNVRNNSVFWLNAFPTLPDISDSFFLNALQCYLGLKSTIDNELCGIGNMYLTQFPPSWRQHPKCKVSGFFQISLRDTTDVSLYVNTISQLQEVTKNASFRAFAFEAFHGMFSWMEFFEALNTEFIKNITIVAFFCFMGILIFVGDVKASVCVGISVLMTSTDLMGMIYYFGLKLEVATSIIMILSIGFSIDHCTHIVLAFINASGTNKERAIKALIEMGPPVARGGFSTFLPFLPTMIFAKSYYFTTFAKMFTAIVGFGLFHSLLLLPILLYLFGTVNQHKELPNIPKDVGNTGSSQT